MIDEFGFDPEDIKKIARAYGEGHSTGRTTEVLITLRMGLILISEISEDIALLAAGKLPLAHQKQFGGADEIFGLTTDELATFRARDLTALLAEHYEVAMRVPNIPSAKEVAIYLDFASQRIASKARFFERAASPAVFICELLPPDFSMKSALLAAQVGFDYQTIRMSGQDPLIAPPSPDVCQKAQAIKDKADRERVQRALSTMKGQKITIEKVKDRLIEIGGRGMQKSRLAKFLNELEPRKKTTKRK